MERSKVTRPLTESQERVLAFLREFRMRRGFSPTQAEIAEGLGFKSPNAAAEHLRLLAKKGVLSVTPGVARGLVLHEEAEAPTRSGAPRRAGAARPARPVLLPLVGHVAAGAPILAEENVEREIDVDPMLFTPRADYLLRVRGESMIEAGILSGDLVAVHKTATPQTGRIAVVRLEDEVTVKYWRTKGSKVVLEPANADYKPIVVDPRVTNVAVEGLVVGLLRLGATKGRAP